MSIVDRGSSRGCAECVESIDGVVGVSEKWIWRLVVDFEVLGSESEVVRICVKK